MATQPDIDPGKRLREFLADYAPPKGVPDELMCSDGVIRPVWSDFIDRLSRISGEEMDARMARGDQYLRDAGVFYRRYEAPETAARDWPLSHMPVLIPEDEWTDIADSLGERADLLEMMLADIYGENRLVGDGHLPAELIARNPEWLRPLVGVAPRSGHFLHFLAFDIGRGPNGDWWVLGDRTQAPSGAGFALENRIATARVYSGLYDDANVTRLAGFFRTFRDTLLDLRAGDDSRVGILTPGPMNDTYFEHAYIARYLGFMLLEGEDLTVTNGRLMVRTVDGLQPVSVLWRRLDSSWADPLELNERSRLGTPGLLGAVRSGNLTMVNALGAGVLETRALLAFIPKLAEVLQGRPLKMPNIATWWCGQPDQSAFVAKNVQRMTISGAYSTGLAFDVGDGLAADMPPQDLAAKIAREGADLVGQQQVKLSTTPAFSLGRLRPHPMSLRVFLARTPRGWSVMPGGFARIGQSDISASVAMQRGGLVSDVWIVGKKPVEAETMLPGAGDPFSRKQPGVLPSRAAENLFWLGRYVERAEYQMRVLRAYHTRLAESLSPDTPLLNTMAAHLKAQGIETGEGVPKALLFAISCAIGSAGHVRDRFSVDGSMALSELMDHARELAEQATPGEGVARAMSRLLHDVAGFSGLVQDNMYRFTGWRFLSIGRALERGVNMAWCLHDFATDQAPEGALDMAIEVGDSVMTHRRRYSVATNRATVLDLLALDTLNPRSIAYQLSTIRDHLQVLPGSGRAVVQTPLQRLVLRANTDLALQSPEHIDPAFLTGIADQLSRISDELALAYLR